MERDQIIRDLEALIRGIYTPMKKANERYYIGECEGNWYAVPLARYEAEPSPSKSQPAFWKAQFDHPDDGGYHPLGGIGQARDRETILFAIQ